MKILKRVVLVILLLFIVGLVLLLMNLDGLIRSTVQTQGTDSLQLATTLQSAHMSLLGGQLNLTTLQIASPSGFSAPKMLSVGEAEVGVKYGQLTSQPIHIDHVTLTQPSLTIEQYNGPFNFKAAMGSSPKSQTTSSGKEPMKLIIDHLTITGATVTLLPGIPGLSNPISITLGTITLNNVGSDGSENGAALKEVVMQILTAMVAQVKNSDRLPASVRALLNTDVNEMAAQLGGNLQKDLGGLLNQLNTGNTKIDANKLLNNLMGNQNDK